MSTNIFYCNNFKFTQKAITACAVALMALTAFSTASTAIAADSIKTISVAHAKGTTQVPLMPKRVVVYDLGALDTISSLGVPVAGLPSAKLPEYLLNRPSLQKSKTAGSLFQPDYGALSEIRPDLIIVGGRSSGKFEFLSKIAPTLDLSVKGNNLINDVNKNIALLGQIFGKSQQAAALTEKINKEVSNLKSQASQAQSGLLLMAINERIMPQAADARFGFLFSQFGAKSAVQAKDIPARGGPAYTFNDVAKLAPQWIYVIDRNTATGQAAGGGEIIPSTKVFDNDLVKSTPAGQKSQIVFLDPKGWYLMGSSGATSLLNNIKQLQDAYAAAGIK